ncbi:spore germination protein [Effusibacillus lacus]|uniref:Spore germination protein n=1 Tax=Effusibacillus lacus TaxID=1348429 RepID=A0A292YKM0_9BACL|nr:spore germination protein [Effusibacillus lacus]TCS75278.1 spore germination protein PF [Effusibacillus lacus]GAX89716.1 spore germination protein [Effusibacillus lacus]
MPALILGPIKIVGISDGGTALFGDTAFIAPKNASKSYSGAGGGITGDFGATFSVISSTNTVDPDVVDSNVASAT